MTIYYEDPTGLTKKTVNYEISEEDAQAQARAYAEQVDEEINGAIDAARRQRTDRDGRAQRVGGQAPARRSRLGSCDPRTAATG